ncbi:very long chain fatty acid elongase 7-like [Chironomus tepperi]|uniref:very long chain fatty acid elongase 7-like n=1 Tax=Chironomus tepperi TaxID=113505 RepID=UPI00391F29D7
MMEIVRQISAGWRDLMENKSDPRVANWPLMSSPFPTIGICLSYVFIVKFLGPKFMENRKPFKLRKIIILYNFLQVVLSFHLFFEAGMSGWFGKYNWRCQPVDFSMNSDALRMANGSYLYYLSKFSEFLDTFFFVLRKRYDQVSTLHVIHHGIMPFSVWWGVKFMPGGHSTFFGFLNTFVHIVMYTYYMMAAIGPEMQKYLWWKKYLTILQMIQFVGIMVHAFQLFFSNPCNYPMSFAYWIGAHAVMFYFLFSNFYKTAYMAKKKKKVEDINGNVTKIDQGTAYNSKIEHEQKLIEQTNLRNRL